MGKCKCKCGGTPNAGRSFLKGHQHRGSIRWKPPTVIHRKPTATEVAWAAGFYEGEGTVVAHRGTVTVSIWQKEKEPLLRLRRWFAGTIHRPKGRDINAYHLNGGNARRFLASVYPLLSKRRKAQARRAGFALSRRSA